ncbi:hypothetical protein EON65_49160 [archaeon]|nr:MAG: hypothetical protein EON65_49160 [archaeon]
MRRLTHWYTNDIASSSLNFGWQISLRSRSFSLRASVPAKEASTPTVKEENTNFMMLQMCQSDGHYCSAHGNSWPHRCITCGTRLLVLE